jgi:hypothetical protein
MSQEILDLEQNQNNTLPVFLKVLCILTFVGAGYGVLTGLFGMITFQSTGEELEQTRELMAGNPMVGDMTEFLELNQKYGFIVQVLAFVGNLMCLFGALLMWKLKKIGFFLYIPGQILPLIGTFGLMGGLSSASSFFAGLAVVISVLVAIFPAAFIIMYGLNYKHLK